MLVLSRRVDEEICIGDDIRLLVLSIQGGKVRLGVEAPDGVRIMRKELLQRDACAAASAQPPVGKPPNESFGAG